MLRAVDFRVPVYLGWIRNCEFSPKSSNLLLCFLIKWTKTPFHVVLITFRQKEKETNNSLPSRNSVASFFFFTILKDE